MPRKTSPVRAQIASLLSEFAERIQKVAESHARPTWSDDVRARVLAALGVGGGKRRGRPPGSKNKKPAAKAVAKAKAKPAKVAAKPKRKVSPKEAEARRLQGQYMGSMRTLPKADVAKVKAERAKSGIHAAIAMAKRLKAK